MLVWTHAGPSILAAFLASLVEFVEALTIVLAVGTVRGWRPALIGAGAAAVFLIVLVLLFGPLLGRIPLNMLQLVIGMLLLLFGMRWLRKAILRAAGTIPLHDEEAAFAFQTSSLRAATAPGGRVLDPVAVATTFKAVLLEGLEVVFIVIAIGATGGLLLPASLGAAAAAVLVIGLGFVLHRPLARVPENTLKFAVGVLISTFGIYWVGEGLGFSWPGADLAIVGLALVLLAVALVCARLLRPNSAALVREQGS